MCNKGATSASLVYIYSLSQKGQPYSVESQKSPANKTMRKNCLKPRPQDFYALWFVLFLTYDTGRPSIFHVLVSFLSLLFPQAPTAPNGLNGFVFCKSLLFLYSNRLQCKARAAFLPRSKDTSPRRIPFPPFCCLPALGEDRPKARKQ